MSHLLSFRLFIRFKQWTRKYDAWSFLSDFFFLFGVIALDWSPVLLILYFMIDTAAMAFFALILFYKEKNDWIDKTGFTVTTIGVLLLMLPIYFSVIEFVDDLDPTKLFEVDPGQLFNPVILPLVLSFSILNHQTEYSKDLRKMRNGNYKSGFIKHFFLRYLLINALTLFMVLTYFYYEVGIVIGLLVVKSAIRVFNKKFREIL